MLLLLSLFPTLTRSLPCQWTINERNYDLSSLKGTTVTVTQNAANAAGQNYTCELCFFANGPKLTKK